MRQITCLACVAVVLPMTTALGEEIFVPTDMPLSVALESAESGDIITILPDGSPYSQFPGYSFANKQLTLRGSTGDPADVVLDGAALDTVLAISGAGADGTVIEHLTFANGGSDSLGGGLDVITANVTVRNCVFDGNSAPAGGGIRCDDSPQLTIIDCTFTGNTATLASGSDGGGAFLNSGTHLVRGCTFVGNHASDSAGALRSDFATIQMTDCTFEANTCGNNGGALFFRNGTVATIDACTFTSNVSAANAGAVSLWHDANQARLRNCVFDANEAATGGAMRLDTRAYLTNCTLVGNTASSANAAVAGTANPLSLISIDNSIFWNNAPSAGQIVSSGSNRPVVRHSIVEGGFVGTNVMDVDPQLANVAGGDLHLAGGSPAIDAGDTGLYCGPLADREGGLRALDDPDVLDTGLAIFGPVIDIGAYERQVEDGNDDTCPTDVDGNGTTDVDDLVELMLGWGPCP